MYLRQQFSSTYHTLRFRKSLAQKRFKSNMEIRYQIIVSAIKTQSFLLHRLGASILLSYKMRHIFAFRTFNFSLNDNAVCIGVSCTPDKDISEILPWDRKSYPTHAILPRTSSNIIIRNCILAYSGTSGSLF